MSEWSDKPFLEEVKHVWFDHGNLFGSRIREEMNGDEKAMELVDDFEESWRELYEHVLENRSPKPTKREQIKEKIKPKLHKKLEELRSR